MTEPRVALLRAIVDDDLPAVEALIAAGVDVNSSPEPHWPPLFCAMEHLRSEIAKRLIAAGADVNRVVEQDWTPLAHAIDTECDVASQEFGELGHESTELTELILAAGGKPTQRAIELATIYKSHKALALMGRNQ